MQTVKVKAELAGEHFDFMANRTFLTAITKAHDQASQLQLAVNSAESRLYSVWNLHASKIPGHKPPARKRIATGQPVNPLEGDDRARIRVTGVISMIK